MAEEEIAKINRQLQKMITKSAVDESIARDLLEHLQESRITLSTLQKTCIGKTVNNLRRLITNEDLSTIAKNLLKDWKKLVPESTLTPVNKDDTKVASASRNNNSQKSQELNRVNGKINDSKKSIERQQPPTASSSSASSSSPSKKRKVLSMAEYAANKKPASTTVNSTQDKLSAREIQEIYAQFNANCDEVAANTPKLPKDTNKILSQNNNRNDGIVNGHHPTKTINNSTQNIAKQNDIWAEDEDDDDDDDDDDDHDGAKNKPSVPVQNKSTVNNKSQQVKKSTSSPVTTTTAPKTEDRSMVAAIASSIASLPPSQSSSRPTQSQPVANTKKSESYNFLRSKHGRQAIYSGRRTCRTNIPSLQDLCVEVLRDNVEDVCRTHFNLLPYEIVKPIIDTATPEQLYHIVDNNPDYYDEVQPLWKAFCALHYKDAELEEDETYYDLYWRKEHEKEARLQRITELAKKKKEQTVDTNRQTKSLAIRPTVNRHINTGIVKKVNREVVGLPPSKPARGQAKPKKPTVPPLLKKALKSYFGKN